MGEIVSQAIPAKLDVNVRKPVFKNLDGMP